MAEGRGVASGATADFIEWPQALALFCMVIAYVDKLAFYPTEPTTYQTTPPLGHPAPPQKLHPLTFSHPPNPLSISHPQLTAPIHPLNFQKLSSLFSLLSSLFSLLSKKSHNNHSFTPKQICIKTSHSFIGKTSWHLTPALVKYRTS